MTNVKTRLLSFAVAAALAASCMGLAACGGGSSSSSASSSSSSASSSSAASSAAENTTTSSLTDLEESINEAYMGVTDTGSGVYYASAYNSELGILVILDGNGDSVSFVGPISVSGNLVTISDEENMLSFTFGVTDNGDGTIAVDMGDIGTATIAECSASEIVKVLSEIDEYSNALM